MAAGLLTGAAATAGAATPPATLGGEAFNASMNVDDPTGAQFPFILGQCGNWSFSTPTFDISGQASGPYPGNFEEHGSVTYRSAPSSNNPWGQGPVLTFDSTFTITESDGVTVSAVGATSLVPNGALAVCFGGAGGGGVKIGPFLTHYTATITNPDGTSSQDSGSSYLTLSQSVGLGEFWAATLIQSFFATPPPPPILTLSNLTATVSGSKVKVSVDTSPAIVNVSLEEGGARVAPDARPVMGVARWTLTNLAPGTHKLAVEGWDSPSGQPGHHSAVQTLVVTVPPPSPPPPSPTPPPPVAAPTASAPTPPLSSLGAAPPPVARSTPTHISLLLPDMLTIPRLLHRGGYVWTLTAPKAGALLVIWRRGHTLIARGQVRFRAPGRIEVRIRLTAIGRRLLRTDRSLRVAAHAIYTGGGGIRVSRRQTLRLVQ